MVESPRSCTEQDVQRNHLVPPQEGRHPLVLHVCLHTAELFKMSLLFAAVLLLCCRYNATGTQAHECQGQGVMSCGQCLAAGPHCAWCAEEVSDLGNTLSHPLRSDHRSGPARMGTL